MNSLMMPSTSRRARIGSAVVAMLIAAGCNCSGTKLKGAAPSISVTPNPIVINDGVTLRATDVALQITNTGRGALNLAKDPYIVDPSESTPQYGLIGQLLSSCTGTPRAPANRLSIQSQECVGLVLRYLPTHEGANNAVLRFESNDPVNPTYDVPITAGALTPQVQACIYEGTVKLACNVPGAPLEYRFEDTVSMGQTAVRTLKLLSTGSRAVGVDGLTMTGNSDFTLNPANFRGGITTGTSQDFTLTFAPAAGGLRSARIDVDNDSSTDPHLIVLLTGNGDGPALCYCVGDANDACTPVAEADFQTVAVGGSGAKTLQMVNCGTQALTFGQVKLVTGGPIYTATGLPNVGDTLAPQASWPVVPLTFSPPTADTFKDTLQLYTANQQVTLPLTGVGAVSGCLLSAPSMVLDFGQAALGVLAKKDYAVSNRGTETCIIPSVPTVTPMAGGVFSIAGFPPAGTPVPPGGVVKFQPAFTPSALTPALDTAGLAIHYQGETVGSPILDLNVTLQGTPVASPKCVLKATPAMASLFGAGLNFGQVSVNTVKVLPVTFQNVGSTQCMLGTASIAAGLMGSGGFTIQTQPASTLQPGDTTIVEVAFAPTIEQDYGDSTIGAFNEILKVPTSDGVTFTGSTCGLGGAAGCAGWSLYGAGVTSALVVLPQALDFGEVTLGCRSAQRSITLYNVGTSTIHIQGFTIDPPTPAIFSVIAPATPFSIGAGSQVSISVRYAPSMVGLETGSLYIQSDAVGGAGASNPYTTVSLQGTGTTDSSQTDVFTQADHPVADVLWVIDMDSNSMADKQQAVSTNAQAFISAAQTAGTDYHLGVISNFLGPLNTNCANSSNPFSMSATGCTISGTSSYNNTTIGGARSITPPPLPSRGSSAPTRTRCRSSRRTPSSASRTT